MGAKHKVEYKRSGQANKKAITAFCSCGWVGEKVGPGHREYERQFEYVVSEGKSHVQAMIKPFIEQAQQTQQAFEDRYNCKMTITKVATGKHLPCPFCGKSDLSVETLESAWKNGGSGDHVVCSNCAASAPVECWQERKTV